MPAKNDTAIKVHMDDSFITDIIDERDRALERNRSLEQLVEVQEQLIEAQGQDMQSAAQTIRHVCANVEAKSRIIDSLHVDIDRLSALAESQGNDIDRLSQLITDAYNVHFGYGKDMSNEEWMSLSVSTLDDMKRIADAEGGQS